MDIENEKSAAEPAAAPLAGDKAAESAFETSRQTLDDAGSILTEISADAFKEIMKAESKSLPSRDDIEPIAEENAAARTAAVDSPGSDKELPAVPEPASQTAATPKPEIIAQPGDDSEPASAKTAMDGYRIKLEVFEGPLDLLLFLIKKKQIDIHDIPIAVITREYLEYLERKEQINLDREGEFLLMAAYLIYIKSQMLLPREHPLVEAEDPRRALVERLLDYQKIKAAAGLLREKEDERLQTWSRIHRPPLPEAEEHEILEVSLFDLAQCFFQLMKRREGDNIQVLEGKTISLEEKMREIITVLEQNEYLDFLDYLLKQETLKEALVSFFCLLELVQSRVVVAVQETLFHTIKVWLRREAVLPFPPDLNRAAKETQ